MALADILQAITDETDAQLAAIKSENKACEKTMNAQHDAALAARRASAERDRQAQIAHLRSQAENQASMYARHAILGCKQDLLGELYASVIDALLALSAAETERMLKAFLSELPATGEIRPTKAHAPLLRKLATSHHIGEVIEARGGFRYIGSLEDRDYTFEFLVSELLRPATEITAARQMFGSH